ncbi:MAG: hypothetical protein Sapg2KO_11690 [Saprospiraceae bacterium]
MKKNQVISLFVSLFFTTALLAQDCDCVPKDNYQYVEYKGRYRTLKIPVECDSLFSMETINDFLNFGDIYYEVAQDFFGWEFLHPRSLETIVNPSLGGAGTGTGGTGYGMSYFGIHLDGFDRDAYAAAYDRNGTIIHEGIHRWDFRGQNYFQGPDIAHPLTVGLQDYLAFKMGMNIFGLYQETTAGYSSDLEIKRRFKYFWRRYLSRPELDWDYYFSRGQSNQDIFELSPKPEAYERLAIQGATLLAVYFMHGETGLQAIFSQIDKLRKEDPTWDQAFGRDEVRERHIKMFGDGLQLDVSDYFDYWKYPISTELRNYLGQYPKSPKIQDLDGDGFSPLQGDFDDDDKTSYPDAPELLDGLDNNQDGQIDEQVHNEQNGDFPNSGSGTRLSLPVLVQGNLATLSDSDAFSISIPERAYVTVVFTALNSDTVIQYGDYQIGIFDGVLRRNGDFYMRQDVQSGENNLHRSEYWEPGEYVLSIDGLDGQTCPGDYELQIFVNDQKPVVFEKNGFEYEHHVYNGLNPDPNFDVSQVKGVSLAEATALKSLYEQNGGENWENKLGWLATEDVCFWRGLSCDRAGLGKLALNYERAIEGPIDASILSSLKNLREFDLGGANFQNQALEDAFQDWRNLSMFRASGNNIRGPLPTSLGNKKKLWFIELRSNQFEGSIPDTWSGLENLKYLDIVGNEVNGALPRDFHQLEALETFYFDQDKVCVPNQAVWNWLQEIPETNGRNFQRCNEVPSGITMLTPIDQVYDLQTAQTETINFDWTESQDPENIPISYTWVLANQINIEGQDLIAPILQIEVNDQTNFTLTKAALADSLSNLGFGDRVKDFFHYAIASDGDWIVSTDTIAIELSLAAQNCLIKGEIITESNTCFIPNSGKAEVQLSKSFGQVRYNWNNGASVANINNLSPGNYDVVVEDQTGCQKILYGFVPVSKLAVDLDRTENLVEAKVNGGTAPYTVAWNDQELGVSRSLPQEETYSMVVMDAQGCQQLILSPPVLRTNSGQTNSSFIAHWDKVPSASGYIVQVATDQDFNQLLEAYEYVRVGAIDWLEIEGLSNSQTYFYRVAAYSADALSDFSKAKTIQLDQESCNLFLTGNTLDIVRGGRENGAIEVFAFGGNGNYTYQWSDNGSGRERNNLAEGSYTVTVTDSENCTAIQTFEMKRIERYAIGNLVWHDRNRNGIQEPGEPGIPDVKVYRWQDNNRDGIPEGGGVVQTDENGIWRHENLDPGSYLIFVWEVDNFDPGGPLFNMVNSPGSLDTNNDFPTDDNGEPGALNNPLPGGSVASKYIVLEAGEEPLQDGDPLGGLFNQDPSGNMTVDFGFFNKDECPDMTARFEGDLFVCDDQSLGDISAVALNAIGPVRYQWSPENQTSDLKQVGVGTYSVLITDDVGCSQTVTTQVRSLPEIELNALISNESVSGAQDGAIELVDSLLSGLELLWSNGSTQANQIGLAAGDYQLTVTTKEGCQKTFDYTVSVITSTQAIYEALGLQIVPNPSADFIQLQSLDRPFTNSVLNGQVLDVTGKVLQVIKATDLNDFNQQLKITSSRLSAGSYFLQLQKENQIANQLFIISK